MKRDREKERRDRKELLRAVIDAAKDGREFSTADEQALITKGAQADFKDQLFQSRRTDSRLEALLDRLCNAASKLGTDDQIDGSNAKHSVEMGRLDLNYRRYVVRKMIHVAYLDYQSAKGASRKAKAAEVEAVRKQLDKAANLLRTLRRSLAGNRVDEAGKPVVSDLAYALHSIAMGSPVSKGSNGDEHLASAKRAEALVDAEIACEELSNLALGLRQRLNQNADDPAKRRANEQKAPEAAFAQTVADAWLYLTGRPHGSQDNDSPFLTFLRAAWKDAFPDSDKAKDKGDGPSFAGFLKRPKLKTQRGKAQPPTSEDIAWAQALAGSRQISSDAALELILKDKPLWL